MPFSPRYVRGQLILYSPKNNVRTFSLGKGFYIVMHIEEKYMLVCRLDKDNKLVKEGNEYIMHKVSSSRSKHIQLSCMNFAHKINPELIPSQYKHYFYELI